MVYNAWGYGFNLSLQDLPSQVPEDNDLGLLVLSDLRGTSLAKARNQ